jgi:DnaJ-class molecular chaperone
VPNHEAGLKRVGSDLHYDIRISPAEAVLGASKTLDIPILGKRTLDIKS